MLLSFYGLVRKPSSLARVGCVALTGGRMIFFVGKVFLRLPCGCPPIMSHNLILSILLVLVTFFPLDHAYWSLFHPTKEKLKDQIAHATKLPNERKPTKVKYRKSKNVSYSFPKILRKRCPSMTNDDFFYAPENHECPFDFSTNHGRVEVACLEKKLVIKILTRVDEIFIFCK